MVRENLRSRGLYLRVYKRRNAWCKMPGGRTSIGDWSDSTSRCVHWPARPSAPYHYLAQMHTSS